MNGTVRAVMTSKANKTILCMKRSNFMLRYRAIGKIRVKNAKGLIKMAFFVDFAHLFGTIDGLLRYGLIETRG